MFFYDCDVCRFSYVGGLIAEMTMEYASKTRIFEARYSCGRINVQLNFLYQEPADRDSSFLQTCLSCMKWRMLRQQQ